jgi:hypothetical protein
MLWNLSHLSGWHAKLRGALETSPLHSTIRCHLYYVDSSHYWWGRICPIVYFKTNPAIPVDISLLSSLQSLPIKPTLWSGSWRADALVGWDTQYCIWNQMPVAMRVDGLCSLKVYIAMTRCKPHEDHGSFAFNPPNAVQKNSPKEQQNWFGK